MNGEKKFNLGGITIEDQTGEAGDLIDGLKTERGNEQNRFNMETKKKREKRFE